MASYDVYDLTANKVGSVDLKDEVFNCEVSEQSVFDALLRQQSSLRQGTHKVKNRREVRGGGKKPFRQKGTGRARQGSIRAVQYKGGGVAFGPTPRSHTFKLNRKVRGLALRSGLTLKAKAKELFVLDSISLANIKTKDFKNILKSFKVERKALFVVDSEEDYLASFMSSRNLTGIELVTVEGLNIYDLQNADKLFLTKKAAEKVQEVL